MTIQRVEAWKDDAGKLHESKDEAIAANAIIRFEKLRNDAMHVIELASHLNNPDPDIRGRFDPDILERFNAETLQPLADYLALLIAEAKARTEKYG